MNEINKKLHEARGCCVHNWNMTIGNPQWNYVCTDCGDFAQICVYNVPDYCGSLDAAFELVERMFKNTDFAIEIHGGDFGAGWYVRFRAPHMSVGGHKAEHESLPMAISLAAASALTGETK